MSKRPPSAGPTPGLLVTAWLVIRQLLMTAAHQPEPGRSDAERSQSKRKRQRLRNATPATPGQTLVTLLREFFYALILQPSGRGEAPDDSSRKPRR